jgi:hypothetical protein
VIITDKETSNGTVPKLALNRVEAAHALGCSPATIDRLTIRGLLRPSRATYRPLYSIVELQRFLKETTQADYTISTRRSRRVVAGEFAQEHKVPSRQEVAP